MATPTHRRKFMLLRAPVVVNIGCGCRRISLFSYFRRKPTTSSVSYSETSFTATSTTTTAATSSSSSLSHSFTVESAPRRRTEKKGPVDGSEEVVKHSSDPYVDFRDSIAEMIVEKEIYSWDELRRLLLRFLALNSSHHHHAILQAFVEICHGVFSPMASVKRGEDGSTDTWWW